MLSIFTIPKPFAGHIGIIQRNAVRSWLALRPSCEITLFGDEEGTAACASEFGVRHFPQLVCNEYGTPMLDDAFSGAHEKLCGALPKAHTTWRLRVAPNRVESVSAFIHQSLPASLRNCWAPSANATAK